MEENKKNIVWTLKKIGEGILWTGGYYAADLLKLFPEHTIAYKVAVPVGFLLGYLTRQVLSVRKAYRKDQLPGGVTKVLDKIPDRITGVRGSENGKD